MDTDAQDCREIAKIEADATKGCFVCGLSLWSGAVVVRMDRDAYGIPQYRHLCNSCAVAMFADHD